MDHENRARLFLALMIGVPIAAWLAAAFYAYPIHPPKLNALLNLALSTAQRPILIGALASGLILATVLVAIIIMFSHSEFRGAPFARRFRGPDLVTAEQLARRTRQRKRRQVHIAEVPIPYEIETQHFLVGGATGTGKSTLINAMVFDALKRGDRIIVIDPNGDVFSRFGRPAHGDKLLNPFDVRTQGGSFFNEIRTASDFSRYAQSMATKPDASAEAKDWYKYAGIILAGVAAKLHIQGKGNMDALYHWTNQVTAEELHEFVRGTDAEGLFMSGAERAVGSTRFILADVLKAHRSMPPGNFSFRRWLDDPAAGNLFITVPYDKLATLRPLVAYWTDALFSSVLSMHPEHSRRLWVFLDELPMLGLLPSLSAALAQGRKFGLCVVAGLQSTAQLDRTYGQDQAKAMRANFRTFVGLGGARSDPDTAEFFSRALGEHDVERIDRSQSRSAKGRTHSQSPRRDRERIVSPAEIAGLPDLSGYLALAGNYPVARIRLRPQEFRINHPAFLAREQ